jgi:hypothetical protein
MKWNCAPKDAGIVEFETDQAYVGLAGELIQNCALRYKCPQQHWINDVVQHQQILPFRGKKRALLGDCHSMLKDNLQGP